jgi:hypothetical protein
VRRTTEKEIEAVLRLDGAGRFAHFVRRVVDEERVWGLWQNGWALMEDNSGSRVFCLWPAREYAELCRAGDWVSYEPKEILLADLIDHLLPDLEKDSIQVGVFPTPAGKGPIVTPRELEGPLRSEMEKYS